jgi:membrane protease YdiL (CAAX protease family)
LSPRPPLRSSIANSLQRHPLAWFFALAFGISWGGILVTAAARGFDLSPLQPVEGGLIFLMMLLGPSLSGLICTALTDGRAGLHALGCSALRWRVPPQCFAVALLTAPVILLVILLPLAVVVGPTFSPGLQWPLLAVGLVAGGFEEIGWTGFATPRLLARHGLGRAGLTLGLLWAFWHLLVDVRFNIAAMGSLWPVEFAVVYLATLTPYRMLMTWVFARTGSLLLAILMHASFTGWLLALFPATSVPQSLAWQAVFALILWALVVLLKPGPQSPQRGLWTL